MDTSIGEHEAKLKSLREMIEASIARGGSHNSEEVAEYLATDAEKLISATDHSSDGVK